jgi:hypothetical protein
MPLDTLLRSRFGARTFHFTLCREHSPEQAHRIWAGPRPHPWAKAGHEWGARAIMRGKGRQALRARVRGKADKKQIPFGNGKRKRAGDSMGGGGAEMSIPQGLKPLSLRRRERAKPEGLAYLEAKVGAGRPCAKDGHEWGARRGSGMIQPNRRVSSKVQMLFLFGRLGTFCIE